MSQDSIVLAPEAIREALLKCQEASLVDATMLHIEAAIDALTNPTIIIKEKVVEVPVEHKPGARCGRCGGVLVKELPVTIHAPLDITSFTKSQLRQPGVEVEEIHWNRQSLLCRACGWSNRSWWRKALGD